LLELEQQLQQLIAQNHNIEHQLQQVSQQLQAQHLSMHQLLQAEEGLQQDGLFAHEIHGIHLEGQLAELVQTQQELQATMLGVHGQLHTMDHQQQQNYHLLHQELQGMGLGHLNLPLAHEGAGGSEQQNSHAAVLGDEEEREGQQQQQQQQQQEALTAPPPDLYHLLSALHQNWMLPESERQQQRQQQCAALACHFHDEQLLREQLPDTSRMQFAQLLERLQDTTLPRWQVLQQSWAVQASAMPELRTVKVQDLPEHSLKQDDLQVCKF
jgi:hypothetical protein